MAKYCDVCDKSYADDLPHCPHCTAEVEVIADDDVADVVPLGDERPAKPVYTTPYGSHSVIDLGLPADADEQLAAAAADSGTSAVVWASLVEEVPEEKGGPASATIDSPSDQELIRAASDSSSAVNLSDSTSDVRLPLDASAVDLGDEVSARYTEPSDVHVIPDALNDSSSVDLGALAQRGAESSARSDLNVPDSSDLNLGGGAPPGRGPWTPGRGMT